MPGGAAGNVLNRGLSTALTIIIPFSVRPKEAP